MAQTKMQSDANIEASYSIGLEDVSNCFEGARRLGEMDSLTLCDAVLELASDLGLLSVVGMN